MTSSAEWLKTKEKKVLVKFDYVLCLCFALQVRTIVLTPIAGTSLGRTCSAWLLRDLSILPLTFSSSMGSS